MSNLTRFPLAITPTSVSWTTLSSFKRNLKFSPCSLATVEPCPPPSSLSCLPSDLSDYLGVIFPFLASPCPFLMLCSNSSFCFMLLLTQISFPGGSTKPQASPLPSVLHPGGTPCLPLHREWDLDGRALGRVDCIPVIFGPGSISFSRISSLQCYPSVTSHLQT